MNVLISCESGGDGIPDGWSQPVPPRLAGDSSARFAAESIARLSSAPLVINRYSPELIDVSRSIRHRQLFSPQTRGWPSADRQRLIEQVYHPYRRNLTDRIRQLQKASGFVIHVSVSSFPAIQNGRHVRTDAGLLYDPSRQDEVDFCLDWIDWMYEEVLDFRVRRNHPRRGTSGGMMRTLRQEFQEENYLGIELALNRAWVSRPVAARDRVLEGIACCLDAVLAFEIIEAVKSAA
ncbi:MAG: N-formylglutamate amidohydrolase [Planctomycetota bacterium]